MPPPQARTISEPANYRFLEGLPPRDREYVLSSAGSRKFSANSVITTQGDPADRLYLLVKGCVRLFYNTDDGRKILLIWLAHGDAFGAYSLLAKPSTYLVSSEAIRDSEVLFWDRATFRGYVEKFPQLVANAFATAAEYVEWYMNAHVALTCYTARERLASVLIGLSRAIGERVHDGIEIDVTNEDLANSANITPYTASRLMSEWQKSHAIVKRRGKVLLRSAERLLLKTV
ncbi:MAG TPA: Crp/Fnr family transcriptional regulator [Candidatus Acidoferrum sp.]|jgi:CRP-like cAMP-binding protein